MSPKQVEWRDQQEMQRDVELREQVIEKVVKDYDQVVRSLNETAILEFFPELNALGIRDEMGRCYLVPSLSEIIRTMEQQWLDIRWKWQQGFTELQLTPLVMPFNIITLRLGEELRRLSQSQQLFLVKARQRKTEVDRLTPISTSAAFDADSKVFYFPTQFTQSDNGSISKEEVVERLRNTLFPGWSVMFVKKSVSELTNHDEAEPLQSEIDSFLTPEKAIKMLRESSVYQRETGFTIEDCITNSLLHLHAHGEINCYLTAKQGCWCLGNYQLNRALGGVSVSRICWTQQDHQLIIQMQRAEMSNSNFRYLTAVRLNNVSNDQENDVS